jgi:hypothetical protein
VDNKDNQTHTPLDLSAFAQNRGWEVSLKTQEDPQDVEIRRKKDLVLFYFALFVVTVVNRRGPGVYLWPQRDTR